MNLNGLDVDRNISQRSLANLARVSFRSVQLAESGAHNSTIKTLKKIATALGYPQDCFQKYLSLFFQLPPDSVFISSLPMLTANSKNCTNYFFNFIDAARKKRDSKYWNMPPHADLAPRWKAIFASSVETLCDELDFEYPEWCASILPLKTPWFPAGLENLKASALVESPVHFRKRNLFVLDNFLQRA